MTTPHSQTDSQGADDAPTAPRDLLAGMRASVRAKVERLLSTPLVASIAAQPPWPAAAPGSDVLDVMAAVVSGLSQPPPDERTSAWREDPDDGTFTVRVHLDYDDLWRGREKELRDLVQSTVERHVTFLTDAQRELLARSPREFLELAPPPESAELLAFTVERVGGSERVVELRVASAPEQLPPYNDAEENGATLDDVLDARLELACSVGALVERCPPGERGELRIAVAASAPALAAAAIEAHLAAVFAGAPPGISLDADSTDAAVIACRPEDAERACRSLGLRRGASPSSSRDGSAFVRVLAERGVEVPRPAFASGARLVDARSRAPAQLFETSFNVYHTQPWSRRGGQKLRVVGFRNGIDKALPSTGALAALTGEPDARCRAMRETLIACVAERFAVNTVSVYDWLVGLPSQHFDVSPLRELGALSRDALCDAVRPFVGTLERQYRMHPSLSALPRKLFYLDGALHDAIPSPTQENRAQLVSVRAPDDGARESNAAEADAIALMLARMSSHPRANERRARVMVITPYREQEALLQARVDALSTRGGGLEPRGGGLHPRPLPGARGRVRLHQPGAQPRHALHGHAQAMERRTHARHAGPLHRRRHRRVSRRGRSRPQRSPRPLTRPGRPRAPSIRTR